MCGLDLCLIWFCVVVTSWSVSKSSYMVDFCNDYLNHGVLVAFGLICSSVTGVNFFFFLHVSLIVLRALGSTLVRNE